MKRAKPEVEHDIAIYQRYSPVLDVVGINHDILSSIGVFDLAYLISKDIEVKSLMDRADDEPYRDPELRAVVYTQRKLLNVLENISEGRKRLLAERVMKECREKWCS
jgi:hypothetical protein